MALPLLLIGIFSSCGHKDIDCPAGEREIEILFEWNNAREAEVGGMTLYFYPLDGYNRIWRFDIAGSRGGRVELPSGTYRLIACNNDLSGIRLEDTGKESTIRATASHRIETGVYGSTGMLYGAVVDRLEITPCGVSYVASTGTVKECGRGLVRCSPDSLATNYTVNLIHVKGLERVRTASVRLEDVGISMLLDNPHQTDTPAQLSIPLKADPGRNIMTGNGCAFGLYDAGHEIYCRNLILTVDKADGKRFVRTIALTYKNLNFNTPHNVVIEVDGIEISEGGDTPSEDVGGIDAIVDGWDVVEINPGLQSI